MKNLQNIPIFRQGTFDVFDCLPVLNFIIHMKHPQFTSGSIFPDIIHTEIQEHTAVFSS